MLLAVNKKLYSWILIAMIASSCNLESKKEIQIARADFDDEKIYSLFGKELLPPPTDQAVAKHKDSLLQVAERDFLLDSLNEDNIIWYGRRLAYLYKYVDAIKVYSDGLHHFPSSYRILRHRGHRYISARKFDLAISDLKNAAELVENQPLQIEKDGIPNIINKPLSNTHFNIWYHLGLAYYLKGDFQAAAKSYETCLQYALNDDLICAVVDWLYMTYRELNKESKAKKLLFLVHEDMTIIENASYYKRIRMYQGKLAPSALLTVSGEEQDKQLSMATQGFGLGNWYRLQGDDKKAVEIFNQVVEGESWSAFGYIAAEVMLTKNK